MNWPLRDYQKRGCRSVVDAFEGKVNDTLFSRVLLQAATGAGKTVIAGALCEYFWKKRQERSLFLADMDTLTKQALKAINAATGIVPDLEQAGDRASMRAPVVVGSIQSMQQPARLHRWPADHFGLVIADEAHMSMADGWQKVLKYFAAGGAKILGVTATPERGDKKSLMRFYEHVAAEIPMAELIKQRHLSPIMVETVPLEIRIHGEITDGDNEAVADELEAYYGAIISAWETAAADRKKTLWFHPSVSASKRFTELLMDRGHSAAHVDGSTKNGTEIIEGFAQGRFRSLNNCQMLTKGYDCPDIDCVVILRPTRGRTPYIQMAGRGTRLYCPHGCVEWCEHEDRKQNMLLLDFLWEFEGHDVMGPADLLTDAPEQREAVARKLKEGGQLDILAADEFVTGEREADLLAKLKKQAGRRGTRVDALTFAALLHQPSLMDFEAVAPWQMAPVSPAQRAQLEKAGIDPDSVPNRGHAHAIGDALAARWGGNMATLKQIALLAQNGIKDGHLFTMEQASATIDQIFAARH